MGTLTPRMSVNAMIHSAYHVFIASAIWKLTFTGDSREAVSPAAASVDSAAVLYIVVRASAIYRLIHHSLLVRTEHLISTGCPTESKQSWSCRL